MRIFILMDTTMIWRNNFSSFGVLLAVPADSGVFESMQPLAGQCQSREQSAAKRTFSDDFHEFVAVCVQRDIIVRPTASQLKKHSFFNVNRKYMNSFKEALSLVQPLVSLTHENGKIFFYFLYYHCFIFSVLLLLLLTTHRSTKPPEADTAMHSPPPSQFVQGLTLYTLPGSFHIL